MVLDDPMMKKHSTLLVQPWGVVIKIRGQIQPPLTPFLEDQPGRIWIWRGQKHLQQPRKGLGVKLNGRIKISNGFGGPYDEKALYTIGSTMESRNENPGGKPPP